MNKVLKYIGLTILIIFAVLIISIGFLIYKDRVDNRNKANAVKQQYSQIKLPPNLKLTSSNWNRAFFSDQVDTLQNHYVSSESIKNTFDGLKTALQNSNFQISETEPIYKPSYEYYDSVGSIKANSANLHLDIFISEKNKVVDVSINAS